MFNDSKFRKHKFRFRSGATTLEYAIVCACIVAAVGGVAWTLGGTVSNNLEQVSSSDIIVDRIDVQDRNTKSKFHLTSSLTALVEAIVIDAVINSTLVCICFVTCILFSVAVYFVKVYW